MERIKFDVKITDIQPINPLFSKVKVYVMYTGKNRNGFNIDKQSVIDSLPSIFNCPIVGKFSEEVEDFEDHGGQYEIKDGEIKFVETTKPYGVIPESSEISWEFVTEEDGTINEYLVCTGYLWTDRYPESVSVVENGKGHSMEIADISGFQQNDGFFNIQSFLFSGLCILGDVVEPCFESSQIVAYSLNKNEFEMEFTKMVNELKFSLSNDVNKGVERMKLEELLQKFSITEEQLSEKIENYKEFSLEELEEKVKEVFEVEPVVEPIAEPNLEPQEPIEPTKPVATEPKVEPLAVEPTKEFIKIVREFELSHDDIRSKLWNMLDLFVAQHELGNRWDFWVGEVYDTYFYAMGYEKNYKISYNKTDDNVELGDYEEVFVKILTADQVASLDNMAQNFELAKKELEELKEYKQEIEFKKEMQMKNDLVAEFGLGLTEDEMSDVVEKIETISYEEMKTKLNEIFVSKSLANLKSEKKFSKESEEVISDMPKKATSKSRYAV